MHGAELIAFLMELPPENLNLPVEIICDLDQGGGDLSEVEIAEADSLWSKPKRIVLWTV